MTTHTTTLRSLREDFKPYRFDRKDAHRAVRFFETQLIHGKGEKAGQLFKLEKWERRIIRRIFGWKHRDSGLRKYKTLWLEIARKNGKSTLGSGLALYLFDADKELGADVISAAADRDQAAIVYDAAKEMVGSNKLLNSRIKAYRRTMVNYSTASKYKVLSSEAHTKHGLNLSGLIVDEVHAHPTRELIDVLITSTASRLQPLSIFLTTAGFDKNSICWEYHEYAKNVIEGVIKDPTFYPAIFAADPDDDWKDEKTWRKANPNLGVTVQLDYLREQCKKAQQVPAYENTFKRLHLNLWTEIDTRWIPIERWDECRENFTFEDLHNRSCLVGIDLSTTTDITAVSFLFPDDDGDLKVLPYFFVPEEALAIRAKRDRVPYDLWAKQGHIIVTSGVTVDYDLIRVFLNEKRNDVNICSITLDRWNATQMASQLDNDAFDVQFFGQGFASMTAPTKEFGALVLSKKIKHNGNPVMRWMLRNIAVEQDAAGNLKPSKKKSRERIDGVVATIMALGRHMTGKDLPSIYESRGIRVL